MDNHLACITSRLARGVFWSTVGNAISKVVILGTTFIVARVLQREHFGELATVQNTIGMLASLAGFGFGITATKYVSELYHTNRERAVRIIQLTSLFSWVTGGLAAVLLCVLAPLLATHILGASQLTASLHFGALLLLFSSTNGAQMGSLIGLEAFKSVALLNILSSLISIPLFLGGSRFAGVTGAVFGLACTQIILWLITHVVIRRYLRCPGIARYDSSILRELPIILKFSLPALAGTIIIGPAHWICTALVVNQPQGYGEMGSFGIANQFRLPLVFLIGVITQPLLPVLSSLTGSQHGSEVSSRAIVAAQLQTSRYVLLGGIPILFMSQYAIALVGKQFADAESIIGLLTVATMIQGVAAVTGPLLMATNRMKTAFGVNLSYALTLITATYLLSPHYGATGLAIGYILAYAMPTLWVTFTLRRVLPKRFTFYIYICLALIASLAVIYFASPKCLRPLEVIPAVILTLYLTSQSFRDKILFPDFR